jgi:ThiF family
MSRQLVSRSDDLQRLEAEGYALSIRTDPAYLLVRVPYVDAQRTVQIGTLVSELTTAGEATSAPSNHLVYFIGATDGDLPCDQHGDSLNGAAPNNLINQVGPINLGEGLVASCSFSHKPEPSYQNYYEKVSTYCDMLVGYAQAIDPSATAKMFLPIETDETESVFRYLDSATSRAGIGAAADKLRRLNKIVIAGLGGTGSYILDQVAKTPVGSIHLYDSDFLETHNAFRAPGAATIEQLNERPRKVHYYKSIYDAIHRHVVAHPVDLDESNIEALRDADFVFVSIEGNAAKRFVLEKLEEFGVPFIDVGMGIYQTGDSLGGIVRTTTGLPGHTDHIWRDLTFADGDDADEYDMNIQLADLNMLNAASAVTRWKRLYGFYFDFENELSAEYTIDGNHLLNEHQLAEEDEPGAQNEAA